LIVYIATAGDSEAEGQKTGGEGGGGGGG